MTSIGDEPSRSGRRTTQRDVGVDRAEIPTRAIVIAPDIKTRGREDAEPSRTPEERLKEAEGLALAIDLDIVHSAVVPVSAIRPATLIGAGKVEEIAHSVKDHEAELVIVDHTLSPVQQRNLEREWKTKVVDRTGLILEIFGRRAQTKEGSLQVELAHLNYQRGRLVRSWTHLERQRGGAGFLGGPGETQIEADRRILRDKISKLEKDLEQVRRTRSLHRSKRRKVPLPVVAFVGYTNAGKSTLFNALTGSSVQAEDMLFATLDPTLRRVRLPGGTWIILSDTVGFISDLPTHLVAAFRATLEEVEQADLVVHIHDANDAQSAAQTQDVQAVLEDLGIKPDDTERVIDVWNKIDLLSPQAKAALVKRSRNSPVQGEVAVSALTGEGIEDLLQLIETKISGGLIHRTLSVPAEQFADVAWLYENAIVAGRRNGEDGATILDVSMTSSTLEAWLRRHDAPAAGGSGKQL